MSKGLDYIYIGGDLRQRLMAEQLYRAGYKTSIFGVEGLRDCPGIRQENLLEDAIKGADVIIGPVPFSRDGEHIFVQDGRQKITIDKFISLLRPHQIIFGGNINSLIVERCNESGIDCCDLMKLERVAVPNAILTAEGAITEAVINSPQQLHQSECLILGYGRCGKALADRLYGLHAEVTVAARSDEQLTEAESRGYRTVHLDNLLLEMRRNKFIFNTIPAMILGREVLEELGEGAIIIDIASNPGGTDFGYCRERKIQAGLYPGLPGKYAPYSAAQILNKAILDYCERQKGGKAL